MTRIKYLVLALATATAGAAPPDGRPRFLPQGDEGTDSCKKDGTYVGGFDYSCEVGLP